MPEWTTACPDWAERLKSGRGIIPPPIFPDEAERRALSVFRELKIVDAPGSPTIGEACRAVGIPIWPRRSSERMTTRPGGEADHGMVYLCPEEEQQEHHRCGGDDDGADSQLAAVGGIHRTGADDQGVIGNAFSPARDMVKHDEELDALLQVQTHVRTITHRESGATLKVVAADSNTVGGKKSVGTLVDELWLFGKQSNAENMLRRQSAGLLPGPRASLFT